jgi:hypothetical protein
MQVQLVHKAARLSGAGMFLSIERHRELLVVSMESLHAKVHVHARLQNSSNLAPAGTCLIEWSSRISKPPQPCISFTFSILTQVCRVVMVQLKNAVAIAIFMTRAFL